MSSLLIFCTLPEERDKNQLSFKSLDLQWWPAYMICCCNCGRNDLGISKDCVIIIKVQSVICKLDLTLVEWPKGWDYLSHRIRRKDYIILLKKCNNNKIRFATTVLYIHRAVSHSVIIREASPLHLTRYIKHT